MNLSHVKHFVAVVEELNFRRAADKLGVAQPTLSRSVQALEWSLGTPLLRRTRHSVALTQAGAVFLEEARYLLARADFARQLTRRVVADDQPRIAVAYASPAWDTILVPVLRAFRARLPDVGVSLTECGIAEQLAGLREGRFDFGFVGMQGERTDGLECRIVRRLDYLAAIPSAWPMASRASVRLGDLRDCPFVFFNERLNPTGYTQFMLACQRAGFVPNIVQGAETTAATLRLVAAEFGVAMANQTAALDPPRGVTLLPFDDLPDYLRLDLSVCWARRSLTRALADFLAVTEEAIVAAASQPR